MKTFVAACLIVSAGGCSTIVNLGGTEKVTVATTPPGANVDADGTFRGVTPLELPLERGRVHRLVIRKPGHRAYQVNVIPRTSGWAFGNNLFGGLAGVVVDPWTGGPHTLIPDDIRLNLPKLPGAIEPPDPNIPALPGGSPDFETKSDGGT